MKNSQTENSQKLSKEQDSSNVENEQVNQKEREYSGKMEQNQDSDQEKDQEQDSDQQLQIEEDSQQSVQGEERQVHRRKKGEVELKHRCPDTECHKAYGTVAALYTHVKSKHTGPNQEYLLKLISNKQLQNKGRTQNSLETKSFQLSESFIPISNIEEKKEILNVLKNPQYIKVSYQIGIFGLEEMKNSLIREPEDPFQVVDSNLINGIISDVKQIFSKFKKLQDVRNEHRKLIEMMSLQWKIIARYQIVYIIVFSIMYGPQALNGINEKIQQNLSIFSIFQELIKKKGIEQFMHLVKEIFECFKKARIPPIINPNDFKLTERELLDQFDESDDLNFQPTNF